MDFRILDGEIIFHIFANYHYRKTVVLSSIQRAPNHYDCGVIAVFPSCIECAVYIYCWPPFSLAFCMPNSSASVRDSCSTETANSSSSFEAFENHDGTRHEPDN